MTLAFYENQIADLRAKLNATTDRRKRIRVAEEIAVAERQAQRLRDHAGRRGGDNDE